MTRDPDALERLCQRVREHEEPDATDRAFVREQLALRLAATAVGAAAVIGAAKSAAASGAAPALGASTHVAMFSGPSAVFSGPSAVLSGAGGALKAWSLAATGAWVAGGASAALVVALVVQSLPSAPPVQTALPPASAAARAAPVRKARAAPAPRATALPSEPAAAPGASSQPARIAPVQVAAPKRSQATEPPSDAAKPSLAHEAAGLARVQRALRDGDPNLALALLEEQDQLYRSGSLGTERAAARALAWCAAGHRTRARTLAERVVAENAGSPLAERVKRKCFGTRSSP